MRGLSEMYECQMYDSEVGVMRGMNVSVRCMSVSEIVDDGGDGGRRMR